MPDPESEFLDALYLSVRDLTEFYQALTILCGLFDVGSAALIDFDAARPEVATQAAIGLFSGGVAAVEDRPPVSRGNGVQLAAPRRRLVLDVDQAEGR